MSVSTTPPTDDLIGRGSLVCGGPCTGVLRRSNTIEEVLDLIGRVDLSETVLVIDSPSASGIVPLLASVRGIVCRSGGLSSHLAILAREFGLSCVMGAELDAGLEVDGQVVVISGDGSLRRV